MNFFYYTIKIKHNQKNTQQNINNKIYNREALAVRVDFFSRLCKRAEIDAGDTDSWCRCYHTVTVLKHNSLIVKILKVELKTDVLEIRLAWLVIFSWWEIELFVDDVTCRLKQVFPKLYILFIFSSLA